MKARIVLLLFATPFAGFGLWAGYAIASDVFDAWRMSNWMATEAQLTDAGYTSHTGDDSTTYEAYASYRYLVQGETYTGNRVAIAGGSDNIGDYQQTTGSRLAGMLARGEPVVVYYDPSMPARSVIDRQLRWGLVGFRSIFLFVFGGIGCGLLIYALRAKPPVDPDDPAHAGRPWLANPAWQSADIRSRSRSAMWAAWGFTVFWNLISAPLPFVLYEEIVDKQNYLALIGLLFPLVGAGLIVYSIRRTREWLRFGSAPLQMDPFPGAIGGHVGGTIDLRLPFDPGHRFDITLSNLKSYVSGSGKNRSRREKALWQDQQSVSASPGPEGTRVVFRIDVPEGQYPSDAAPADDTWFLWRLTLSADLPGADLDRDYELPVYPTGERSRALPELRIETNRSAQRAASEGRLRSLLNLNRAGGTARLHLPIGRNLGAAFGGLITGAAFAAAGAFIVIQEGRPWFGGIFLVVGVAAAAAALYAALNSLTVTRQGLQLTAVRRWLGVPVSRKSLPVDAIRELTADSSFQTQSGGRHVMHYSIRAQGLDGTRLTLAEGLRGQSDVDAARRLIAREFGLRTAAAARDRLRESDVLAADV